ncbi:MAG: LURP-one-related/scramblase family protein [Candidatus Enterenecus sp.]
MKLLFKQRFFSWFDSYDIYGEDGETVFTVEGRLSWGHCLHILDSRGEHIGTVQQKVLTLTPRFELYEGGTCLGEMEKELFTFFRPRYHLSFNGWEVEGNFMEWDYSILDSVGNTVAVVSKELFHWTDTYVIDVADPRDALRALMVVLAIDAEKCSRD